MANNSDDFRRLMNLMESLQEPVLLEGWVDRLAGVFNGKSMGANERAKMAKELYGEWNKWLGKTDRVGDLEDMIRFMKMRVGFNDADVELVFDRAGIQFKDSETNQEPDPNDEPQDSNEEPEAKKPSKKSEPANEYDPEEGVPIPKDLDAKIMPYQNVGTGNKAQPEEPQVLRLTDRKFRKENGENDIVKIMNHLNTYPAGTKAIVGGFSYTSSGKKYHNKANRVNDSVMTRMTSGSRQLFEADEEHTTAMQMTDILDKKVVKQLMDFVAAQVNDEYLLNGPERDREMAQNGYGGYGNGRRNWGRNAGQGYQRADSNDSNSTDNAEPDNGAPRGSGKYDAKVMKNILKTELEASDASQQSMAQKVQKVGTQYGHNGFGHMTQSDMELLAKIGYAFLRSK